MEKRLAEEVGDLAKELGLTIATAESATGGLISNLITDISGSSDYFKGGVVAYDNEVKAKVLGVSRDTLERYGAVSSETGKEMAEGTRKLLGADIGLSDTGVAGPTGATPEKPVGLFYTGLSSMDESIVEEHRFSGNRIDNKVGAAQTVLGMAREYMLALKGCITEERHVVTCFLEHDGAICILRRSDKVGTYKGAWAGVSGYIESGHSPFEQAMIEIEEEAHLSLADVEFIKEGDPLVAVDRQMGRKWIIHPYHFRVEDTEKVRIDWEHTEFKWIDPEEIAEYETVPKLREAWNRLAGI